MDMHAALERPPAAAGPGASRHLLFLSHRFPYPPNRGEKIRAFNLIRHLAKSWRIHLGCLVDDPADWEHVAALRSLCADLACFPIDKRRQKLMALARFRPGRPLMLDYYRHAGLQAWVDATLARERLDAIYVYSTAMAPYVLGAAHPNTLLDMVDVDSEKWAAYARSGNWAMRPVWAREARTLLAFERQAVRACRHSFLVSEPERRRFAELAPDLAERVTAIENGVDLVTFAPDREFASPYADPGPHVAFTGNMAYRPNIDAVVWFADAVLPLLRRDEPGVQFHIVGADPAAAVARLAQRPGIHVTGRVADVRGYVAHAAVCVAPLRIARGIQNKVIEAMAMGRPVVASPQAAAGVRAVAGRDLLVADGPAETVRRVAEVLGGRHPGLGPAGRRAAEAAYAWSRTLAPLDGILAGGMAMMPTPTPPSAAGSTAG